MKSPEKVAQLSLGDSDAISPVKLPDQDTTYPSQSHHNQRNASIPSMDDQGDDQDPHSHRNFHYPHANDNASNNETRINIANVRPSASQSFPLQSRLAEDEQEKFRREIALAKEDLIRFRHEMDNLTKQMNGMATDLRDSKSRVSTYTQKLVEIEQDLTMTQEVNVDLQVLLENAVKSQKESESLTTQTIRKMHSNLANIVYENSQLQERLASIASHQRAQQGNVLTVSERMREYVQMLEQAQGTIQLLHTRPYRTREDIMNALSTPDSRRASEVSSMYITDDDESSILPIKQTQTTAFSDLDSASVSPSQSTSASTQSSGRAPLDIVELYRHRIIHRRPSLPANTFAITPDQATKDEPKTSPQYHLKQLLNSQGGHGLGLSSIASPRNRIP